MKTKVPREFTVTKGNFKDLNLVDMVRKYATLRPSHTPHARFFINYKKGRCTVQPVGINTFGGLPPVKLQIFWNPQVPKNILDIALEELQRLY
jgi:hypothetical protein